MYSMRPYTADFVVEPAKIMYNLRNYHHSSSNEFDVVDKNDPERESEFQKVCMQKISSLGTRTGNEANGVDGKAADIEVNGTASTVDQNQVPRPAKEEEEEKKDADPELIKRLLTLSKRLDKFIAANKKSTTTTKPGPSDSPEDSAVSATADKWLSMASTEGLDFLSRQLNSFLGSNDFLSSQNAIGQADIAVRSLFATPNAELIPWQEVKAANNVQLWIKRVDEAVATK